MSEQAALDFNRRVRSSDPGTSVEAAIRATRASRKAVEVVRKVMADGFGRTDEEVWASCRIAGFLRSSATVRHARLALTESGVLRDTGERRNTSDGSASRVWVLHECPGCIEHVVA